MDIIIWLIVGLVVWFVIAHLMGKPDFWQLTRKHQVEAWNFFNSKPEWFIEQKPSNLDVVGPFRVTNPYTGDLVKIYCDSARINQSQNEFIATIKN